MYGRWAFTGLGEVAKFCFAVVAIGLIRPPAGTAEVSPMTAMRERERERDRRVRCVGLTAPQQIGSRDTGADPPRNSGYRYVSERNTRWRRLLTASAHTAVVLLTGRHVRLRYIGVRHLVVRNGEDEKETGRV